MNSQNYTLTDSNTDRSVTLIRSHDGSVYVDAKVSDGVNTWTASEDNSVAPYWVQQTMTDAQALFHEPLVVVGRK